MQQPIPAHFVSPGHILIPAHASILQSVVTWGILVSCFHSRSGRGGVAHFLYPKRRPDKPSNALFAAPAIVALVKHFSSQYGRDQLEVQMIGGAVYDGATHMLREAAKTNIATAEEIFDILHLRHIQKDVGGNRARRIIFHSGTGELIVAKVDKVRKTDWMYSLHGPIHRPGN